MLLQRYATHFHSANLYWVPLYNVYPEFLSSAFATHIWRQIGGGATMSRFLSSLIGPSRLYGNPQKVLFKMKTWRATAPAYASDTNIWFEFSHAGEKNVTTQKQPRKCYSEQENGLSH